MTTKNNKKSKKRTVVFLIIIAIAAFAGGYFLRPPQTDKQVESQAAKTTEKAAQKTAEDTTSKEEKVEVWTCPMHPQIRLPKPGNCPICGMELVPAGESSGGGSDSAVLRMSPAAAELAEIQTGAVQQRYVTKNIRMTGKVTYDEQRLETISAWVPGRLDKLFVDFTGTKVQKGDHMVYMYSPKVMTAQKELLQAIETVKDLKDSSSETMLKTAKQTVDAAREKLRLWGLTKEQVNEIEKRGTPSDHITINAPRSGTVIMKKANEGDYVKTGSDIYHIADLSRVWVMFDAYESDLQWLKYGQPVTFEVEAYPGRKFKGRISFIEPFMTEKTRTVKVRVNAANPEKLLKPGMFVHAKVKAKTAAGGLVVDPAIEDKWVCPMHPSQIKDEQGTCDICGMDLVKRNPLATPSRRRMPKNR